MAKRYSDWAVQLAHEEGRRDYNRAYPHPQSPPPQQSIDTTTTTIFSTTHVCNTMEQGKNNTQTFPPSCLRPASHPVASPTPTKEQAQRQPLPEER